MANPPGTFKKLQDLGPEIVKQVDILLLGGETPTKVARMIRNEWGMLLDLKESSVKKNLERYRANVLKRRVIADIADRASGKPAAGLQTQLIAMDELSSLVEIQKGRLHKILMKENSLPAGILLQQASKESVILKDMLGELGKLQLETGVMRRAPKVITGQVVDPDSGESRQFTWTEEQESLLNHLENLPLIEGGVIEDAIEIPETGPEETA